MANANRSVVVRLMAEVGAYVAGMARAKKSTDDVADAARRAGESEEDFAKRSQKASDASAAALAKQQAAADKLGGTLLKMGAVGAAGLGLVAKAAMDWESAWTGVTKTVDGTPQQMAELEAGLRNLAKTLPSTHEEIAAVAEAAGQLGVARQDILGFTKTMIDLSVSTNLTADEAATQIAQISNVMGTMSREGSKGVERFGAALVALGNDGASTEADILAMAQRIAGASAIAGASEADVLALANTLSSMGVKAELGGGASQRAILKMNSAVKAGGDDLEAWASVAGVTSKEFAKAFNDSPMRALDLVAKGLGRINTAGEDVSSALSDIGLAGTENAQVMLALAASGDLLTQSLDLGKKAWDENTALAVEAGKRYETTESKVKVAWNGIQDAAIDAGAVLLPIIKGMADGVKGVAEVFGSLPGPVQGGIVALTGIATAGALAVGGFLKISGAVRDIKGNLDDLGVSGSRAGGVISGVGKAAGVAAAAYAALSVAAALVASNTGDATTSTEQFINALAGASKDGAKSADAINSAFQGVLKPDFWRGGTTEVNNLGDAMKRVFNASWQDNMSDFGSSLFGQNAASGINVTKNAIGNLDKAIASMAQSGNIQDAAAGFKQARDAAEATGKGVTDIIPLFPAYADAVRQTLTANGETQVSQERLAQAMLLGVQPTKDASGANKDLKGAVKGVGDEAAKAAEFTKNFLDNLEAMIGIATNARQATADFHTAVRDAAQAAKDAATGALGLGNVLNGTATDFDLTTEAGGRANSAFQNIVKSGMADLKAAADDGVGQPGLQAKLSATYDALITAAGQFGITGDAAVNLARDVMGVPKGVNITTWMSDQARIEAAKTKGAVDAVPNNKSVTVSVNTFFSYIGYDPEKEQIARLKERGVTGVLKPGLAGGGGVYGSGPKGVDSVEAILAPGEHVLTAKDVDAMGGQAGVYAFRASLHRGGRQAYADGGAVMSRFVAARSIASAGNTARAAEAPTGSGSTFNIYGVQNPAAVAHYTRQIEAGNVVIGGSSLG